MKHSLRFFFLPITLLLLFLLISACRDTADMGDTNFIKAVFYSRASDEDPTKGFPLEGFLENKGLAAATVLSLKMNGIDRFMLDSPYAILNAEVEAKAEKVEELKRFIRQAHEQGIRVEAIYGGRHWWRSCASDALFDQETYDHVFEKVIPSFKMYQDSVETDEQFDAFQYNVEFWTDDAWTEATDPEIRPKINQAFINLLDRTAIELGTIPLHGWLTFHLQNADESGLPSPESRTVSEVAIEKLQSVHIATAWNKAAEIVDRSQDQLGYAIEHGTEIFVSIETVPEPGEPQTTFFGGTLRALKQELAIAEANIRTTVGVCDVFAGFTGYNYDGLMELTPGLTIRDSDGDGIEDLVDEDDGVFSNSYSDGWTSGNIIDRDGLDVKVWDVEDSDKGVLIIATSPTCSEAASGVVKLTLDCDPATIHSVPVGSNEVFTCPSFSPVSP